MIFKKELTKNGKCPKCKKEVAITRTSTRVAATKGLCPYCGYKIVAVWREK